MIRGRDVRSLRCTHTPTRPPDIVAPSVDAQYLLSFAHAFCAARCAVLIAEPGTLLAKGGES